MAKLCLHSTDTVLFMFHALLITCYGFTVDVENNDGQVDASATRSTFKLRKYNDIWTRAVSKDLPENKLHSLKRILSKLDRTELDIKHHSNSDDKKLESHLKEHLNEILKDYGLLDEDVPVLAHHDIHFNDERINSLWREAMDEGKFTTNELHSLHKEMRHMEGKMEEVHALAKEADHFQQKVGDDLEFDTRNNDNLVEPIVDKFQGVKELDEFHTQLKDKRSVLSEQVKSIEEKIRSKPTKENSEFTDDRVLRLWNSVRKSNFTATELGNVREELRHFQKHIDKLQHWERLDGKFERSGENEKDLLLAKEKVNEYKRKVKKYHKTMLQKMKEHRVEL